jgi:hypothetical protein
MEGFSNLEDAVKYIQQNQKKVVAYQKQQDRMATYQKANPDKCREKALKYYANIKANDPDKYAKMKEQKRTRYNAQKEAKEIQPINLEGANGMHPSHQTLVL